MKRLPAQIQQEAWGVAQELASDVFPTTVKVGKLHGYDRVWKAYVAREYRLLYTFDEKAVYLLRIGHRKEIYRREIPALLAD